jgi:cytochrome c oxidase subunit III
MLVTTTKPVEIERDPRDPADRGPGKTGGGDAGEGGRRPPEVPKYTGGGGDGDDWSKRPAGHRGPRESLQRHRFGLFSALIGDLMFFVAIVGAFLVRRSSFHIDAYNSVVTDWRAIQVPSILWLNTIVLALSSITMEIARRGMFVERGVMEEWLGIGRPVTRRVMPWLLATLVLGSGFVVGQVVAWRQLAAQHIFYATSPAMHFFYLITGVHALHLAVGLAALIVAVVGMRFIPKFGARQVLVDCTAWYWHAMGVLWIFLFVLLEYCQ